MFRKPPVLQIRIVRIWLEGGENGRPPYRLRFSLENPETGSRRSGKDFDRLAEYLEVDIRQAFGNEADAEQDF